MSDPLEKYRSNAPINLSDGGADPLEKYRDLPQTPSARKTAGVVSHALNKVGVGRALESGGKLAQNIANEVPGIVRRGGPGFQPGAIAEDIQDPKEAADRLRSTLAGPSLGLSAKAEGGVRKLAGDPGGMAAAEDATSKAVEKYPVENLVASMALPAGPELKGYGAIPKAVGQAATQGTYGGISAAVQGRDPVEGVAKGLLSSAAGSGLGALEKPLENASGKAFVKAVSPRAGIADRLDQQGVRATDAASLGHEFRKAGLVPFFGGKEAALRAAEEKTSQLGKAYPVLDKQFNDSVLQSRQAPGVTVGGRPANAPASTDTYNFHRTEAASTPQNLNPEREAASGPARRFAERMGAGTGGLGEARAQMDDARRSIPQGAKVPLREDLRREAFDKAREDYYAQIKEVLGPEKEAAQRAHDREYAIAKTAQSLAEPAVTREVLHQGQSPLGAGLAMSHGGIKEALIEALTEQAVRRSAAPAAYGLHLASTGVKGLNAVPALFPTAVRTADEESPWLNYFNPRKK